MKWNCDYPFALWRRVADPRDEDTILDMSHTMAVEDRLAVLEREVAALKRMGGGAQHGNWLEQVAGSMQDEPDFDTVLELGRLARSGQRATGDDQP